LAAGYNVLLTIPVGATSITVREEATSGNYLGKYDFVNFVASV
jgi:hypothetical protein